MQFFKPESFMLLWVLPLLIFLFIYSASIWKKRMARFADLDTVKTKLVPHLRPRFFLRRFLMISMVFVFSILALARPQWGEAKKKVERKGVDIIFMLDTSLSMLAEDNKPNRLEKARIEIKNFVHSLEGDRIGMVAFAGSGFLQAPLTLDYSAFFLFLDAVDVGYIPDPGTSLLNSIRLAIESFPEKDIKHKAIILFTDGEDHAGGELNAMIELAKENNVRIYAIGMGSEEGEPIPLKDELGRRSGYKKDRAGQVVITKINKENLEKIASETGGLFLPSSPSEREVQIVLKHLSTLGKRQFQERLVTEREDHFQIFLVIAFIFLLADMLVQKHNKKKPSLPNLSVVLICFLLFSGFIDTTSSLNEKGNELFNEKNYDTALDNYRKAQVKDPDNPSVLYNLATTLYQKQEYQEAKKQLEKVIDNADSDELKAKALYNYGNTLYRLGSFDESIKAYEQALEITPDDEDAKFNLEFLQKTKNKFEKENQDKQQENQNKQDQKQQQQDQNQQNQQQQQQQKQDQNQQNQNQQNQKDQQQQDQKQDNQDQQDQGQGEEDEKDQDQQGGGEQEKEDQKPEDKDGDQESEKNKDEEGDQESEDKKDSDQGEESEEPKDPKDEPGDQESPARPKDEPGEQEQPQQPQPQPGNQPQPQPQQETGQQPTPSQGQGQAPLQGQMTMDNALRILDALKEGEKELQDLRRPPTTKNPAVILKDW